MTEPRADEAGRAARDIDDFLAFFRSKGIECAPRAHPYEGCDTDGPPDDLDLYRRLGHRDEDHWVGKGLIVSVSQCHFVFDTDGRFVGTHADDMGYFVQRVAPPAATAPSPDVARRGVVPSWADIDAALDRLHAVVVRLSELCAREAPARRAGPEGGGDGA
jgi:hypothetical protein